MAPPSPARSADWRPAGGGRRSWGGGGCSLGGGQALLGWRGLLPRRGRGGWQVRVVSLMVSRFGDFARRLAVAGRRLGRGGGVGWGVAEPLIALRKMRPLIWHLMVTMVSFDVVVRSLAPAVSVFKAFSGISGSTGHSHPTPPGARAGGLLAGAGGLGGGGVD